MRNCEPFYDQPAVLQLQTKTPSHHTQADPRVAVSHCPRLRHPSPLQVARDPSFLSLMALLGLACTLSFYLTHGSLLAATLTHIALGAPYALLLGGWRKLHCPIERGTAASVERRAAVVGTQVGAQASRSFGPKRGVSRVGALANAGREWGTQGKACAV